MTGMSGVEPRTAMALERYCKILYGDKLYDMDAFEDMVLATAERENYSNIGTDTLKLSTLKYVTSNAFWINVCLFVNSDFRDCFHDAILIEKALMQVSDVEYQDFRDDMTLESDGLADTGDRLMPVRLDSCSPSTERVFENMLKNNENAFYNAGMSEAYGELLDTMDRQTAQDTSYVIHNAVYMTNAMDKNGVFNKYVHLVVDSVKKQLS